MAESAYVTVTGERFMFGLVFTAGRSRLARRHHRIESARPIDPWRATIIQAENWAEYLGVEVLPNLKFDTEPIDTTTKDYWDQWDLQFRTGESDNLPNSRVGVHLAGIFTSYWLV
ncbi:hypothetical protein Bbelb_115250 [Branchiostoma belcheri]|nr:hypothetical protein Bbelb_115250 [Branchiostoma belcheri]